MQVYFSAEMTKNKKDNSEIKFEGYIIYDIPFAYGEDKFIHIAKKLKDRNKHKSF